MKHQEPTPTRRPVALYATAATVLFLLSAISMIALRVSSVSAHSTAELDVVLSDFDNDGFDGWQMYVGEKDEPLEWRANGGCCDQEGNPLDGNGNLYGKPTGDARTSYYLAPPKFVERDVWLKGNNHILTFDIKWGGNGAVYYESGYESYGDVVVGIRDAPGERYEKCMYFSWTKADFPEDQWVEIELPLWDTLLWELCPGSSYDDILGGVDGRFINTIEIRAEYGVFTDWSHLDNVALVFEAAPVADPVNGIVKVNNEEVTQPTKLEDLDRLLLEVENILFPPTVEIQCGVDDEDILAAGMLSRLAFDEFGPAVTGAFFAPWTEACQDEQRASFQEASINDFPAITLEEGAVHFLTRSADKSLKVTTAYVGVEFGADDSVVVRHIPEAGLSSVFVLSGRAEVSFPSAGNQPLSLNQGDVLIVDANGPQPLMALPQLFLPVVR